MRRQVSRVRRIDSGSRPGLLMLLLFSSLFVFTACDEDSAELFGHVVIGLHMVQRFDEEWGIDIDIPPIKYHSRPCPGAAPGDPDCSYVTSIIYQGNTAYEMRLVSGASSAEGFRYDNAIRPEGTIDVLAIGIARNHTSLETDFMTEWSDAQDRINQQHADYATALGLAGPIMTFNNTNVVINHSALGGLDVTHINDAKQWVIDQGHDISHYDVVMILDLDPKNQAGGGTVRGSGYLYMRWFPLPNNSNNVDITPTDWDGFARASYHHEIGHLHAWGHHWPNEWAGPGSDFITCPTNFGWTDVDGDGVVEILDSNPYTAP